MNPISHSNQFRRDETNQTKTYEKPYISKRCPAEGSPAGRQSGSLPGCRPAGGPSAGRGSPGDGDRLPSLPNSLQMDTNKTFSLNSVHAVPILTVHMCHYSSPVISRHVSESGVASPSGRCQQGPPLRGVRGAPGPTTERCQRCSRGHH